MSHLNRALRAGAMLCAAFLCPLQRTSLAGLVTWTGSGSTDWFNNGNWSPNTTPSATDSALIVAAANQPIVNGLAGNVSSLTLTNGTSLGINNGAMLGSLNSFTNNGT